MHQGERAPALNEHLALLANGEVEVRCGEDMSLAVYKPARGERPLWDFPSGLYRREVAAWRLSTLLGWDLVPETVARTDGPLGEGSLQRFVEADFEQHYFTLYEDPAHHDALRRICAFDLVANNADRKSGHCLLTPDGHIWGIDNGLCFSTHAHVRTVIWEFGGEPVPDDVVADLTRLVERLPGGLEELLDPDEVEAVTERTETLIEEGVFPLADAYGRAYPWPLV